MSTDTALYEILGENIKKIRRLRKVGQSELAKIISLSRSSISNIESGVHKPSLFTIYEIAIALDCEIEAILPSIDSYKTSTIFIDKKYTDILDSLPNEISKKNLILLKGILKENEQ